MRKKLTNNLGLKLLSLVCAVLLWLIMLNTYNPVTTKQYDGIEVTPVNEETLTNAGKVYTVADGSSGTLSVRINVVGRKKALEDLKSVNFKATADFNEIMDEFSSGDDNYLIPIRVSCTKSNVDIESIEVTPTNYRIQVEAKETKSFTVRNTADTVNLNSAYEVVSITSTPRTVEISGPESLIKNIMKVETSVTVSSAYSAKQEFTTNFEIYDNNNDKFTDRQMEMLEFDTEGSSTQTKVEVNVWKIQEGVGFEGITFAGEPAEGYEYDSVTINPAEIAVAGREESLQELETAGNKIDLGLEISLEGATEDIKQTFIYDISDADISDEDSDGEGAETPVTDDDESIRTMKALLNDLGLRWAGGDENAVAVEITVHIKQQNEKTVRLSASNIQIQNLPAGYNASFASDSISIRVRGSEEKLKQFTSDNIKAVVDLSGSRVEGRSSVPLQIELPDGIELKDEVSAEVNISYAD